MVRPGGGACSALRSGAGLGGPGEGRVKFLGGEQRHSSGDRGRYL